MSSDIPVLTTTNSRLRGGINQRKNLGRTGENVLGGTSTFENSAKQQQYTQNDLNSTQSSNGYVPRQRGGLVQSNNNQNYNAGVSNYESQNSYNPGNNYGGSAKRYPQISEQQIDSHTSKIEREIENLDVKLSGNKNGIQQNSYSVRNINNNQFKNDQNVFNLDDDNNNNFGNKTGNGFGTQVYGSQNGVNSSNQSFGFQSQNSNTQQKFDQTGQSQNFSSSRNNFNSTFSKQQNQQEKKLGTERALDIFEQKELELKQQISQIEKQKQQQEKVQEIKEKAQFQQQQNTNNKNQQQQDLKLKLSSPVGLTKKGSIIENQKRQLFQQKNLGNQNNSNNFKPNLGLKNNNSATKNSNLNINNNNKFSNQQQDVLEDSTDYLQNGYLMAKDSQNKQQQKNKNNNTKKPVKNLDNEIAVATGVNEALFEESQQLEDVELITCPEGCGRQFTEKALQKHVGVCKKLFQKKKSENNSNNKKEKNQGQQKSNNNKGKVQNGKQNLQEFKKKMKQQKIELEQKGELDMKYV